MVIGSSDWPRGRPVFELNQRAVNDQVEEKDRPRESGKSSISRFQDNDCKANILQMAFIAGFSQTGS